VCVLLGSAITE